MIRALGAIHPAVYRGNPAAATNVRSTFTIIDNEFNTAARGGSSIAFNARVRSGAESLTNVAGDISSAPNDPLAWYGLHSDDISTITTAVKTGMQIQDQQTSSQNFGAGLRLSYSPVSGFMIYGGVQLLF